MRSKWGQLKRAKFAEWLLGMSEATDSVDAGVADKFKKQKWHLD